MSIKARSKVWNYFDIPEDDQFVAVCNVCKSHISRCGVGKKSSTSSLLKHLKFKHTEEYRKIQEQRQGEISENFKPNQRLITNFIKKTKTWDITDARSIEMHKAIAEMIALDNQPYTLVTDRG
ncbi:hypothetical protein NQ314_018278 [Rhamnusium bicolor]|uniref:BED-type domain-containing protein n=1 Tax=Rhamnusium bicolor TaxID=1586634 RepID=A0AAV8WQU0_9CUCU|nr:hypothetical protein NQ314_018278 [Rhamnusium bicolor]